MTAPAVDAQDKSEMTGNQNWLVTADGNRQSFGSVEVDEPERIYRMYRFLTDLEDILDATPDDRGRLEAITPRVRQLLISSYWLQMEFHQPPVDPGWSVNFLYREHEWPLTVQMVAWLPGNPSPIHNHAAWAVVAIIGGQEKNTIWRRVPDPEHPDRIEKVAEMILNPGDIITFMPDAIHSVEPLGDEPTISFNLYGKTTFKDRYEFDPETHTANNF
ncbi:MAG: cupin [Leptolyngbyaceae cyanobacterium MO_188.B28]|nr:cupin [Leptolyngbyaceae cyanobacterium MO_188.B28]